MTLHYFTHNMGILPGIYANFNKFNRLKYDHGNLKNNKNIKLGFD